MTGELKKNTISKKKLLTENVYTFVDEYERKGRLFIKTDEKKKMKKRKEKRKMEAIRREDGNGIFGKKRSQNVGRKII